MLFKQLVDDISSRDELCLQLINLSAQQGSLLARLFSNLQIMWQIIRFLPQSHVVSLQASLRTTLVLGPFVWFLCKLFHKKCNLRKFGGVFHGDFERLPVTFRWLIKNTVLKMDLLMFETQALVDYFSVLTTKPVVWYPNNRPISSEINGFISEASQKAAQKFVFIGHVKQTKGVQEIIEAANQIEERVEIDVYGPIVDSILEDRLSVSKVQYKGVLLPENVAATLQLYDVLLLPTYHEGEGYPGVILEAYCNGLPVIATQWNAILEIVNENSGILIQPKNVDELTRAILKLVNSPEEYARLRAGAVKRAREFSSEYWSNRFVEYVLSLAAKAK